MVGSTFFAGVALLTLVAPFELTAPLLSLPRQSVSNLEAAVLCAFVFARHRPRLVAPAPRLAHAADAAVDGAARRDGRGVRGLARVEDERLSHDRPRRRRVRCVPADLNGVTTPTRLRSALTLAVAVGVVVSVLAILEYRGVRVVLSALRAFRPAVSTVGAQVRAGGPLQYPTIASMYLEVVFACGLGVMLAELDSGRPARVAAAVHRAGADRRRDHVDVHARRPDHDDDEPAAGRRHRPAAAARRPPHRAASPASRSTIALLFAGSRSAESLWLRLTTEGQESWYRARIVAPPRLELATGSMSAVPITLTNTGRLPWDSQAMPPLLPSYHWLGADGDRFVTFEGERTPFREPVLPDSTVNVAVNVRAPRQPGRYRLEWDLVQEGRLWFSTEPGAVAHDVARDRDRRLRTPGR